MEQQARVPDAPDPEPDRIRLTGIEVMATHGVYAREKTTPQPFVVDLVCRLRPRPDTDDLATTVDYSELTSRVADVVRSDSVDLIETLAERISRTCLTHPRIAEVEVTVHKPRAPLSVTVADVAVTITRRNPK